MSLLLTLTRLHFPNNNPIANPITVDLSISQFYSGVFTLIEANVLVNTDGTINASPLPSVTIDPTLKYVIRAVNKECDFTYDQNLIVNPYCPPGYELSMDQSYCFFETITDATPPTNPQSSVSQVNVFYTIFGSLIFDPGYNSNGTGTFTQISYANPFWVNGPGYPTVGSGNTSNGPLNRTGLWSSTILVPQDLGFSVCINISTTKTYYIGIGCDDSAILKVDGNIIVQQDLTAIHAYLVANGYPAVDTASNGFRFWYIYPVTLSAGTHILEMLGHNSVGTSPGSASMGVEIYDNTSAEIQAATSYSGLNLIFSSKDYIGQQIVLGTSGVGYSCAPGYALSACSSPFECVKIVTSPVLY